MFILAPAAFFLSGSVVRTQSHESAHVGYSLQELVLRLLAVQPLSTLATFTSRTTENIPVASEWTCHSLHGVQQPTHADNRNLSVEPFRLLRAPLQTLYRD